MALQRMIFRSDMLRCALCHDAPCTRACGRLDPATMLRSIWFDNEKGAASAYPADDPCANCPAPCESACVRPGEVPIRSLMARLRDEVLPGTESVPESEGALRTDICGIPLVNPFLLSSSVVSSTYDMCARAFDAGWAGAAFKTVCSFGIHEASPRYSALSGDNGAVIGFKNIEQLSDHSVEENMKIFRELKRNYPSRFILASIMGQNDAEWERLAGLCEENGADAIELNFSCPNMADEGLGSDIGVVPELVERFTAAARRGTGIPILAKLTPNVTEMSPAAEAARSGGADGIAAINTIKSVIAVNPHTYVSAPSVRGMSAFGGYSGNAVRPIALRFIAELGRNPALDGMHISGMGGIETWADALEFILLGARSIQVTTAVMQYGYRIIDDLLSGLSRYLAEKGFSCVGKAVGLGLDSISETTDVLERDTIVFPKFHPDRCIGCGRCVVSCADGGHSAIRLNAKRRPVLDTKRCVGCHLCALICPARAITPSRRRISRKKQGS